jgi:hypothetical protein
MENSDVVCYFNKMPVDVMNIIASFLMETEEEFVERTKIKKEVPLAYHTFSTDPEQPDDVKRRGLLSEFCPDETKIMTLRHDCSTWELPPYVMIIDLQKEDEKDKVMFEGQMGRSEYQRIALSCGGNRIAFFHHQASSVPSHRGERVCTEPFVEIQKIDSQKDDEGKYVFVLGTKQELPWPRFEPERMGFNKQGTYLIAHGRDCTPQRQITHKIYSLKTVGVNKEQVSDIEQVVIKTKNMLQEYLRDKFVCNKYIEGTK